MNPSADYKQSADFLERWKPGGPWVLTSIHPDQKKIATATFLKRAEVTAWLKEHGKDRNIYFGVNPVLRSLGKKAERADIKELAWLHVDIDPRVGEDIEAEQKRALKLLQKPPGNVPPPTVVVFSGGGYQGFWRLKKPIPINGEEERYEDTKLYNLQLEVVFAADPCHNVDRIMRLPGTVNRPNERKRKKGRKPALAELTEWHDDRTYDIDQFIKAPAVQTDTRKKKPGARHGVAVGGNVMRLKSVDELPDSVPGRCKVAIVQGLDPDEPNKLPSRSEWLFWVCCELVRAGCSNDTIYSVITDPDFLISKSVLDKGSRVRQYALHQIERARDQAVDPALRELNDRHAVIGDIGGKCRVLCESNDEERKRRTISYQSFADFRNRYDNLSVTWTTGGQTPKAQSMPMGKWWVAQPARRQYDTVVFAPGKTVAGAFNLWSGFAYDARPGKCDLFLDHVFHNLCQDSELLYEYMMGWMALCVQRPDRPGHVAMVMRGAQGTGKSFFANMFGALFGNHYLRVSNSKHVVGNFNAHLRDCVVLFADEAFYAGDKKHESILKTLITEEMLTIEPKGVDALTAPNYLHVIMASNDKWVVPAGFSERRFFVVDVSEEHKQDTPYFRKIRSQMEHGGFGALLHQLLTHDVSSFDVRKVPSTEALQEQKMLSLPQEGVWWLAKLRAGEVFEGEGWPAVAFSSTLSADFVQHARSWNGSARSNETRLGIFMRKYVPNCTKVQVSGRHTILQLDGTPKQVERPWAYAIPDLETCRAHWSKHFGGKTKWPDKPELVDLEDSQDDAF